MNRNNLSNCLQDISANSDNRHTAVFCAHLQSFRNYLQQIGFSAATQNDKHLFFNALSEAEQKRTCQHLKMYLQICADAQKNFDLSSDKKLFWTALAKMKLRPPSDLMARIDDNDLIEIYDTSDWVQIYRSLSFMSVCSYSLDEILCRPWYELYNREESVTKIIAEMSEKLLQKSSPDILQYNIPPYILEEKDSPRRLRWLVESRFLARLRDDQNRIVALANVARPICRID